MIAILLILFQVHILLGRNSTCDEEKDPTVLPKSAYYFAVRGCDIHLSVSSIESVPAKTSSLCTYRGGTGTVVFQWSNNSLAILTPFSSTYVIAIVPVNQILGAKHNATLEMNSNNQFRFIGIVANNTPQTCHRVPNENTFICYTMINNRTLIQTKYELRGQYMIDYETTIQLPPKGIYTPIIGSYITSDGTSYVWIMHRPKIFYHINVDELKKTGNAKIEAHRLEYGETNASLTDLMYSDPGGIMIKDCFGYSCIYRYHALGTSKTLLSTCLLDTAFFLKAGIVMYYPPVSMEPCRQNISSAEEVQWLKALQEAQYLTTAYIPIQLLALATFIYLCFFFYFAFNPHHSSNLAELSAIVEDEISHLSVLTSKVVRSMKAERQRSITPGVLLMKRPEQSTQESLEEVWCPGATCNSWQCPHNRYQRE